MPACRPATFWGEDESKGRLVACKKFGSIKLFPKSIQQIHSQTMLLGINCSNNSRFYAAVAGNSQPMWVTLGIK
ncbi:MAG: hypothetical protein EBZ77_05780 [Chitinophagia bacterium]|nr:hypothetical protein [Chitinophagia bacterium]